MFSNYLAMNERTCLNCQRELRGRSDQKFCSDQCRNTYNNKRNADSNNFIRKVNYTLRKNRRILAELNPGGKTKIHRKQLIKAGFDFDYFTGTYTTRKGHVYYFCYEQGYLPIDDDMLVLVRKTEDSVHSA